MVLSTAVLVLLTKTFPSPAMDQSLSAMDMTLALESFNLIALGGWDASTKLQDRHASLG